MQHRSDPFQAGAGIDIFLGQRRIAAVIVAVKLGKDQIPDFEIAIAIAADCAIRFAAAAVLAQIDINLRTGTTGTGADFPEIILHPDNPFRGQTNILVPDFKCFIIVGIDGNPKFFRRQAQFDCYKLPGPSDGILLEIIAE